MITINNSFSLKLKELRQKNNLTQDQLANELNTRYHLNESKATISQFEHNKRIPDLDRLINIADYFKVSLDYLCCNGLNDNVIYTNPGSRIKKLIKKNGLSQKEFVEKFNEKYVFIHDNPDNIRKYSDSLINLQRLGLVSLDFQNWLTDNNFYQIYKDNVFFKNTKQEILKNIENPDFECKDFDIQKGILELTPLGKNFIDLCL